jgi:two-component system NarL family sensor kinase
MSERPEKRGLVVALSAVAIVLAVGTLVGTVALGVPLELFVNDYILTNLVIGVGMAASGALLTAFRPRNPVGWIILAGGVGHLVTASLTSPLIATVAAGWPFEFTRTLSTLVTAPWQLGLAGLLPLALLLFPDGRLPSRRWLPVAVLLVLNTAYQIVTAVLSDGAVVDSPAAASILSIGFVIPELLDGIAGLLTVVATGAVLVSLIVRYVRGDEMRRRQIFWILLAFLAIMVINSQRWLTGDGPILLLLSTILLPIAIAIAVLRHRLLDIRLVVSRTLLYIVASIVVIAAYAGLVALLSLALPTGSDRGAAIVAALAVAVGFAPLRALLQRIVDRAFFGGRANPERAANRVGKGLQGSDDIADVLESTRAELRLPYLAVRQGETEIAAAGAVVADGVVSDLALTYGGRDIGTLVVGLRPGEKELHEADRRVFALTAPPLAVALHATSLAAELERSRAGIVSVREEERRRLHRDLHDGLGPVLTGAAFRADAVSNVIESDPRGAKAMLVDVRSDIRSAIDSVRRVVYGVRPLDLEQRGLVGALEERARDAHGKNGQDVAVDVVASGALDDLPAATQLAAYRIAVEALTNVLRHSDARTCTVSIVATADEVAIDVTDDGSARGSAWKAGVGMSSIFERADELGGTVTAGPTESGGRVSARLPLAAAVEA